MAPPQPDRLLRAQTRVGEQGHEDGVAVPEVEAAPPALGVGAGRGSRIVSTVAGASGRTSAAAGSGARRTRRAGFAGMRPASAARCRMPPSSVSALRAECGPAGERLALPAGWRRTRAAVLAHADGRCQVPGCRADAVEIDHILPVARGGTDNPANLRAICRTCNRGKGAQMP